MPLYEFADIGRSPHEFNLKKVRPVMFAESTEHDYHLLVSVCEYPDHHECCTDGGALGFLVHFGSAGQAERCFVSTMTCELEQLRSWFATFQSGDMSYWFETPGDGADFCLHRVSTKNGMTMKLRPLEAYEFHYHRRGDTGMPSDWSVPLVNIVAKVVAGSTV